MATKSKLEQIINDSLFEAVGLQKKAEREAVESKEVADAYVNALLKISDYCKARKRY